MKTAKSIYLLTLIGILFFLIGFNNPGFSQEKLNTWTYEHENGKIVKKEVTIDFLTKDGQIKHKYLDSIKVYHLDSVVFIEEMPELYEIYGRPLDLRFKFKNDSIILKEHSPEFIALFSVYHTIKGLRFYKKHFKNLVNFENQKRFKEIKIYLGEFINCNPREYVFNPVNKISPTTIYHEVGHRAFCQLDDLLPVGDVSSVLHNGLLEYFTATIADHPVVGEGFLPDVLTRDLSNEVLYPKDKYYYKDFIADFYEFYKDTLSSTIYSRRLYELNKKRAKRCEDKVLMTHQSGLLIAHPLWQLRTRTGSRVMDSLVVESMKKLLTTIDRRSDYLEDITEDEKKKGQWYDLLYALYVADQELYGGSHQPLIRKTFKAVGYNVDLVSLPGKEKWNIEK